MFDDRDNPEHLIESLKRFLGIWHGHVPAWYRISADKLSQVKLPFALKELYSFAGNWPGDNYFGSVFAYQDVLTPFELLSMSDGKLVFAWENQGAWTLGTDIEGFDPPVWIRFEDEPWRKLCNSLAQFLVTFCLRETAYGCKYVADGKDLRSYLQKKGKHVGPLWLEGPYVGFGYDENDLTRSISFHIVNARMLLVDDERLCTYSDEAQQDLASLFSSGQSNLKHEPQCVDPLSNNCVLPAVLRKSELLRLSRQHEKQASFHSKRSLIYREFSESLDTE